MKKYLFVISSMSANGAERVMSLLTNHAAKAGNSITLALLTADIVEYELDARIQVKFIGSRKQGISAAFERLSNLRKLIKSVKPDVIISFLTTCNIYCCLAGIGMKIPVIISERNDPIRDCPSAKRRLVRNMAYCLADGYIFQTAQACSCFSDKIQRKATVIPNPVKTGLPYADRANSKDTVIAAGRLTAQKNYRMMLDAFAVFHQQYPTYSLRIFGKGQEEAQLKAYAKEKAIENAVYFMGLSMRLHQEITDAGMFVLSSDYEGISNSLLEAMAMGLPCVSTDCPAGGSAQLIRSGINGLLTPVGDATAFASAMCKIAQDKKYADSLGEKAKECRTEYSEQRIVDLYFKYIENVENAK